MIEKYKFIKDIFTESKYDNKYSSKKVAGLIAAFIAFTTYWLDGFDFYTINLDMFNGMLIYSGAMLGVSIFKAIKNGISSTEINKNENKQ